MSPYTAWIPVERRHPKPTCPEFVVELMSPADRRGTVHERMLAWIESGCLPGWMIDRPARSITIYRRGREHETHRHRDHQW